MNRRPKSHRTRTRLAALLAALALSACSPASTQVAVATRVAVTITPKVEALPFDPEGARLLAASREVADLAGHPVVLDVDAAIVPELRSGFEEALRRAFENVARDLADLRARSPKAFAYGATHLERIRVRYDATKTKDEVAFDAASRTLSIVGPAKRDALVAEAVVRRALEDAHRAAEGPRFAGATPDTVPADERRDYFDYLTGRGTFRGGQLARDDADLASSPRAAQILSVLKIHALVGADRALASDVERWLASQSSWFTEQYTRRSSLVRALPADCEFRRAEAAYGRWMTDAYRTADDDLKLSIAQAVFVRSFSQEQTEQGSTHPPFAWPTIDRLAFGLEEVDAWRAAGYPTAISEPRVGRAAEFVACPRATRNGASVAPRCSYDWYRFALDAADGRRRLATALIERGDPKLTETAFAGLTRAGGKPIDTAIAMLRAVEESPVVWSAGLRTSLDLAENVPDRALLEEAQRLWLEHADYRGLVLLLLARIDRYDNGNVDWRGFANAFGGTVTASELRAFVAEGPDAIALLPVVWPALAKGYSRAEVIVPKLDALLDPSVGRAGVGDRYQILSKIIGRLCAEKNVADLGALRTYIVNRVATHPGEPYVRLVELATADRCKPPPPSPPPRNEVRLVSSKERLRIHQKPAEDAPKKPYAGGAR